VDTVERLPLESVRVPSLILCEHRHRYELAAAVAEGGRVLDLCCGVGYGSEVLAQTARAVVGVDNDAGTIETARAAFGSETVSFEVADALRYLRSEVADGFDVIVCFEGIEHVPYVEELFAELRRHAERGARLVLSVPNSLTLGEQNDFHETDFDRESAMRHFERFERVRVLSQFLAEGSLVIERPGDAGGGTGGLVYDEEADLDYANHYVAFVNADPPTSAARMQLASSPLDHRYIRSLERANAELARANAKLARGLLGSADSAGAAVLERVRAEAREEMQKQLDEANEGRGYAETLAREAWAREEQLKRELEALPRPFRWLAGRWARRG
jgi:2-polyprenyl-3-methyl-5-hydroxy-6-metoxy-1,4-benzoquinol methylase